MVARTAKLPNIRKIYVPDPDHVIVDADLAGADARVVAWEADCKYLKDIFNAGKDLHWENAKLMFETKRPTKVQRNVQAKRAVHAAHYGVAVPTMARSLGVTQARAQRFLDIYFEAVPEIPEWHERVKDDLLATRTITNAFGFRFYYTDRVVDYRSGRVIPKALHEMLAWGPQSTVAIVTNKGLVNIHRHLPHVEPLIQVHDSLVMQTHKRHLPNVLDDIRTQMTLTIPYDDPLTIPVDVHHSDKSWGDCK